MLKSYFGDIEGDRKRYRRSEFMSLIVIKKELTFFFFFKGMELTKMERKEKANAHQHGSTQLLWELTREEPNIYFTISLEICDTVKYNK